MNVYELFQFCSNDQTMDKAVRFAGDLNITVGTLTTAINNLLKKGYVNRKRGEKDRRVVYISLSENGQTMNPSTEDMLNAIEQVNAETVFILPNNKNIILAATQAQSLVEDKNVVIIPTTVFSKLSAG